MRFFDTSPTGRILNRFSSDVDCMDERLPRDLLDVLQRLVFTAIAIILVSLVNYWVAIPAVPVVVLICLLCRYYLRTSRETKRLSLITASPVFSHYVETIQGIETIRAYNKEKDFFRQLCRLAKELEHNLIYSLFQLTLFKHEIQVQKTFEFFQTLTHVQYTRNVLGGLIRGQTTEIYQPLVPELDMESSNPYRKLNLRGLD